MAEYLLSEVLPEVYKELMNAILLDEDYKHLISQLPNLLIISRCGCKQMDCASFYVRDKNIPEEEYGYYPEMFEENAVLENGYVLDISKKGMITSVEILGLPGIRKIRMALNNLDLPFGGSFTPKEWETEEGRS